MIKLHLSLFFFFSVNFSNSYTEENSWKWITSLDMISQKNLKEEWIFWNSYDASQIFLRKCLDQEKIRVVV